MNKYQKKEFIIDLLKANQSIDKEKRKPIDDFSKSFTDSISPDLGSLYHPNEETELNKISLSENIKLLQDIDVEDGVFDELFSFLEITIEEIKKSEPIETQGQVLDTKGLADQYAKAKEKFIKYGESQDINNL